MFIVFLVSVNWYFYLFFFKRINDFDISKIYLRASFGIVEAIISPLSFNEANLLLKEFNHILSLTSSDDEPKTEKVQEDSQLEIIKYFDDIRNGSFQFVLMEG